MKYPLTILHISDLHFSNEENLDHYWNNKSTDWNASEQEQHRLLDSLARDFKTYDDTPNLIIVTGDLLDKANAHGVALVVNFLRQLVRLLNISVRQCILAPGNHDVQSVPNPDDRWELWERILDQFYGNAESKPPCRICHRALHYDFTDGLDVEVVAFNSCESTESEDQHGFISKAQLDCADGVIKEGNHFRIAVMHHHLASPEGLVRDDYSIMKDAASIRNWLAKHRFHLAFHGHQHVDWHDIHLINDWHLAVIAGSSIGVGDYGRSHWGLRLGYQIVKVETPGKGRRIRREYSEQRQDWIPAAGESEVKISFGPYGAPSELPVDFSFVSNVALRNSIESQYKRALLGYKVESYLQCLVECGGILEGLLAWGLVEKGYCSEEDVLNAELSTLIVMSSDYNLIGPIALGLVTTVSGFRTLINPYKRTRQSARPDAALALCAFSAIAQVSRSLKGRTGKSRYLITSDVYSVSVYDLYRRQQEMNFFWLEEAMIGGCRGPQSNQDLQTLKMLGIRALIRLADTSEARVNTEQVNEFGIDDFHEPMEDFTAPTLIQISRVVAYIERMIGKGIPTVVSCGAGYGRTGLMLCCYLIKRGSTLTEAEAILSEHGRPSWETKDQKSAVEKYANSGEGCPSP